MVVPLPRFHLLHPGCADSHHGEIWFLLKTIDVLNFYTSHIVPWRIHFCFHSLGYLWCHSCLVSSLTSILFDLLAVRMKTVVQTFLASPVCVEHKTIFYTVFQKDICVNEFGFIFGAQLVWYIFKRGLCVDSQRKGGWFFCPQSHYWQTDWMRLRHIAATTQAGWNGISVILWGNCYYKRRCLFFCC